MIQSRRRVEEIASLKAAFRYNDALRLCIMQSEVDELVDLLDDRGDRGPLARCLKLPPPPMRSNEFVEAIRNYDWTTATELAKTSSERCGDGWFLHGPFATS